MSAPIGPSPASSVARFDARLEEALNELRDARQVLTVVQVHLEQGPRRDESAEDGFARVLARMNDECDVLGLPDFAARSLPALRQYGATA